MLKWLFRKRIAKMRALEDYLAHFNADELAYLKNISLMGLMAGADTFNTLSPNDRILLCAYIQAEWLVATGQIEADPVARGEARARYNIQLAKDAPRIIGARGIQFFSAISPHQLDAPDFDDVQEDRLGNHAIVLQRIFRDPNNASTLPELNALGEGEAWLRRQ